MVKKKEKKKNPLVKEVDMSKTRNQVITVIIAMFTLFVLGTVTYMALFAFNRDTVTPMLVK